MASLPPGPRRRPGSRGTPGGEGRGRPSPAPRPESRPDQRGETPKPPLTGLGPAGGSTPTQGSPDGCADPDAPTRRRRRRPLGALHRRRALGPRRAGGGAEVAAPRRRAGLGRQRRPARPRALQGRRRGREQGRAPLQPAAEALRAPARLPPPRRPPRLLRPRPPQRLLPRLPRPPPAPAHPQASPGAACRCGSLARAASAAPPVGPSRKPPPKPPPPRAGQHLPGRWAPPNPRPSRSLRPPGGRAAGSRCPALHRRRAPRRPRSPAPRPLSHANVVPRRQVLQGAAARPAPPVVPPARAVAITSAKTTAAAQAIAQPKRRRSFTGEPRTAGGEGPLHRGRAPGPPHAAPHLRRRGDDPPAPARRAARLQWPRSPSHPPTRPSRSGRHQARALHDLRRSGRGHARPPAQARRGDDRRHHRPGLRAPARRQPRRRGAGLRSGSPPSRRRTPLAGLPVQMFTHAVPMGTSPPSPARTSPRRSPATTTRPSAGPIPSVQPVHETAQATARRQAPRGWRRAPRHEVDSHGPPTERPASIPDGVTMGTSPPLTAVLRRRRARRSGWRRCRRSGWRCWPPASLGKSASSPWSRPTTPHRALRSPSSSR